MMPGRWTYWVSAGGVVILAAAAFTLSYDALHQLALDSQVRPSLAWLWPVVIDGTIVVALLTVLAAKCATRAGYPWTLAGLFSAASVAFNIAHAPDRPVAQLVFAMAPIALVFTTHLLMQQVSWRRRHAEPGRPAAHPVSAEPDMGWRCFSTDMAPATSTQVPGRAGARLNHAAPDPDLDPRMAGQGADTAGPALGNATALSEPEADLQTRARRIYQQHQAAGRRMSGLCSPANSACPSGTGVDYWPASGPKKAPPIGMATAQRGTSRQVLCPGDQQGTRTHPSKRSALRARASNNPASCDPGAGRAHRVRGSNIVGVPGSGGL
jgi:hypothetical protein